ncbi:hypothetical protein [Streptomyces sp. DSM 15324]|uniref:hypothetical protein n=1 Tax=Streptomyces sp. DSM 15324 TaxID=1739111 RepID=UPI00074A5A5C|nr:hypothetical protein [Streptomyces sp. DSM 15324]KUO14033.1 hypothetical protein AQJ58_02960 [Streptomyces sp. DSM 15324]
MSARESFEDRLLAELRREIELREEVSAPRPRPLVTRRRVSLALGACAVAAAVAVAVPGSAGGSGAYAVERHGDGSVTLTLKKRSLREVDRQELAKTLSEDHIKMTEWGSKVVLQSCTDGSGRPYLVAVDKAGRSSTVSSWRLPVVLHPGDKVTLCRSR